MASEVGEVAVAVVDTPASTEAPEYPPPPPASTEAQEGSAAVVDMPTSTEMKEVPAPLTPEAVEVPAVAVEIPEVVAVMPASPPPGPPEAPPASTKGKPPLLAPFTTAASEAISVKKVVVIYNPVSGGKRGQKLMDNVVNPAFKEAGVEVVALATQHSGHGVGLAETADLTGVDALCALGGDGTLSEVINGFMRREPQPSCAIGFLPGGTGNTFMHDVMGKKQRGEAAVRAAVAVIVGGLTRKVDLSRLECFGPDGTTPLTRYSINIVTAGFGVVINAKAETRRWMGPARYSFTQTLEIVKLAFGRKSPPCTFTIDGEKHEFGCFVICMMNNKHTGASIRVCPRAQLDDGKIDIMYTPSHIGVLKALKLDGMIKAGGKHIHDKLVSYKFATSSIELATAAGQPPLELMVDGDIIGVTPLKTTVLPAAFTLLTPGQSPPS